MNEPLSPEREKLYRGWISGNSRVDPVDSQYLTAIQILLFEIDRLRALPCQPPGTPEGYYVKRLYSMLKAREWHEGQFRPVAELAPLPQKDQ